MSEALSHEIYRFAVDGNTLVQTNEKLGKAEAANSSASTDKVKIKRKCKPLREVKPGDVLYCRRGSSGKISKRTVHAFWTDVYDQDSMFEVQWKGGKALVGSKFSLLGGDSQRCAIDQDTLYAGKNIIIHGLDGAETQTPVTSVGASGFMSPIYNISFVNGKRSDFPLIPGGPVPIIWPVDPLKNPVNPFETNESKLLSSVVLFSIPATVATYAVSSFLTGGDSFLQSWVVVPAVAALLTSAAVTIPKIIANRQNVVMAEANAKKEPPLEFAIKAAFAALPTVVATTIGIHVLGGVFGALTGASSPFFISKERLPFQEAARAISQTVDSVLERPIRKLMSAKKYIREAVSHPSTT